MCAEWGLSRQTILRLNQRKEFSFKMNLTLVAVLAVFCFAAMCPTEAWFGGPWGWGRPPWGPGVPPQVNTTACPQPFITYANPLNCSTFIRCYRSVPRTISCPPYYLFDVNLNRCVIGSAATCATTATPTTPTTPAPAGWLYWSVL